MGTLSMPDCAGYAQVDRMNPNCELNGHIFGYGGRCVFCGAEKPRSAEQPAPRPNEHPAMRPLLIAEMEQRDRIGLERYGTRLQPHNGRDFLRDALDEALDLAVYLRGLMYERDGR
jgi:hypothetical protein